MYPKISVSTLNNI